ncbi:hypothetical protein BSKO_09867 [Bryopsis sp. KO-2023]|nr:hypothetical protein BSKO_09867 [Bryopsis sp. KO-2023]
MYVSTSSLAGRVGGRGVSSRNRAQVVRKTNKGCEKRWAFPSMLGVTGRSFSRTRAATSQEVVKSPSFDSAVDAFGALSGSKDRFKLLLEYAASLPSFPEEKMTLANRVMGCTAKVWVSADLDDQGLVHFSGTSDSELTKGLCAILVQGLSGLRPEEILEFDPETLGDFGLGPGVLTKSRTNGFLNMVETMKKRTRMLVKDYPRFPSLVISADALTPIGDFAKAQAEFLEPDREAAKQLAKVLEEKKVGVVAHFYMDPEVQGMLSAAKEFWPHIHVSDSLVMADLSVEMAVAGCESVAVLGVDFMSENVRAILSQAGHADVKVFRMASDDIGCSLAEAAESENYLKYLSESSEISAPHLHVIYINTSLRTKALANQSVPTITCTSSNVVPTILQAFAQVPDLNVWYGPDTYMGRNLVQLFESLVDLSDEEIKEFHPEHDRQSIRSLLGRLRYFQDGTCIVHHLFGGEVCQLVQDAYGDAYLAAHFEVPGEMFTLAMEGRKRGMGVVGSTSQILSFISDVVADELENRRNQRLQFVLGTEAGMITSIVRKVQSMLREKGDKDLEVEIVFPVSPQSITTMDQTVSNGKQPVELPETLAVIPGPAAGEGCSLEGGCANCPYMKMNTLAALNHVLSKIGTAAGEASIQTYKPKDYEPVNGISIAEAGCVSIVHMRGFQKSGKLTDDLVGDIMSRNGEN